MNRRMGEEGFTLIEMILAIAIGGIIVTVIASAFIITLKTDGSTITRLNLSRDRQVLANFFVNDVESTTGGGVVLGATSSVTTCSSPRSVLRLSWTPPTGPMNTADYTVEQDGTTCVMYRTLSTSAGSVLARTMVVRNLLDASSPSANATVSPLPVTAATTVGLNLKDSSNVSWSVTATLRSALPNPSTTTTTQPSSGPPAGPPPPAPCALTAPVSYSVTPSNQNALVPSSGRGGTTITNNKVTISSPTSGICTGLLLTMSPVPVTGTYPVPMASSGSTWNATLSNNAYSWPAGTSTVTLIVTDATGTALTPVTANGTVMK